MHKSDYEALISNPVWQEIVSTIEEVREGLKGDIMSYDPITQCGKIADVQGRYKMAEFVLALPADILREINEKTKLEEKEDA